MHMDLGVLGPQHIFMFIYLPFVVLELVPLLGYIGMKLVKASAVASRPREKRKK